MTVIEIDDIKKFITKLISDPVFDDLLLVKMEIKTNVDFVIDGQINKEYYDDPSSVSERFVSWKEIKNYFYMMIRGKTLPLSFKMILALSSEEIRGLIASMDVLGGDYSDVEAISYNIIYDRQKLVVTTGCSMKVFTLDKVFPLYCDEYLKKKIMEIISTQNN